MFRRAFKSCISFVFHSAARPAPLRAMCSQTNDQYLPLAQKFVDFVNNSPTPFHAVDNVKKTLIKEGFAQLNEREKWDLKPLGKYFYTRNQTTIIAFAVGGKFAPGNGLNIIGAHTDSPNLKLKPNPDVTKEGFVQLEIEPYGGGLWTTWFDRDLTIAGRVIVKNNDKYESRLVKVDRPILRIPTLAIHLDRESGSKLEFNKQTHLFPVLATAIKSTLESEKKAPSVVHHVIAKELGINVDDIKEIEMSIVDTQKSVIGGLNHEFIFSPRLDNLMMSFCSLESFTQALSDAKTLEEEKNVLGIALFDHEEIGSESTHGAASPMVMELVKRINKTEEDTLVALRKSFLISADMAHSVHPNYSEKHDANHKPKFHHGLVIKANANQRYATNGPTAFLLKELAKRSDTPVQDFVVRNDSLCGSTIGPIISARTGIRTVDVGIPQLSMHSIREMAATSDVTVTVKLFKTFFQQFTKLDEQTHLE